MDIKTQIRSLLKEAELYRSQGLLQEAKETYLYVGQMLKEKKIRNKKLLTSVSQKIQMLNKEIDDFESAPVFAEMSDKVQEVIKTKFAFAKEGRDVELEGAIALAKFGQYEGALKEFDRLLDKAPVRAEAALNIVRCHKALDSIKDAVSQYHQWTSGDLLTPEQLNKIRVFLQDILKKKGMKEVLPEIKSDKKEKASEFSEEELAKTQIVEPGEWAVEMASSGLVPEDDIPDISSVEITLESGPQKGDTVELDVSFQSGNTINLLISSRDKSLIENLEEGMTLKHVRFYSPMAMFSGKGKVTLKSKIETGPKQGDYSLDIAITISEQ